jgi:DNA-binding protein HU-beta
MPAKTGKASAKTTDVAEYVAQQTGMSPREARAAVKATFEGVARLLKKNERVAITGIGAFSKTVKPAQKGGKKATNPFTGEQYVTKAKPASTKVKFRAGKGFTQHLGK